MSVNVNSCVALSVACLQTFFDMGDIKISILLSILLLRKQGMSLSDQHSILSFLHFSIFLKIPQNRNTLLPIRRSSTNFCLSIAHFLSFEGGHFLLNFNGAVIFFWISMERSRDWDGSNSTSECLCAKNPPKIDHIKCQSATSTVQQSISAT